MKTILKLINWASLGTLITCVSFEFLSHRMPLHCQILLMENRLIQCEVVNGGIQIVYNTFSHLDGLVIESFNFQRRMNRYADNFFFQKRDWHFFFHLDWHHIHTRSLSPPRDWDIYYRSEPLAPSYSKCYSEITFPIWVIVVLCLPAPLIAFVRGPLRRRRRLRENQCIHCGYILGTDSRACSECGTPISEIQKKKRQELRIGAVNPDAASPPRSRQD